MGYATVIVGTDGSPTAERAVQAAAEMAAGEGAQLVVVTAFSRDPEAEAEAIAQPGVPSEIQYALTDRHQAEELAKRGRAVAKDVGVGKVVVHADEGVAPDVLLDAAEMHAADLIVVGSRGMTGMSRFVLGAVANTVSHHAPCDVLIVHTS